MRSLTLDEILKFWSKVNKTDSCWLWTAGLDRDGYGGMSLDSKSLKAHRVSWFLEYGIMPTLDVLHQCDVRNCVNPDHLFLGTNRENTQDAIQKGRRLSGEKHSCSKVSDNQVKEIRFKVVLGLTCAYVGSLYGLSSTQVHRIYTGKSRRS